MEVGEPIYFESAAELRAWLAEHHASERELWVGFHKRHTGRPSVTWAETVDEALCVGWIDGIRKRVDDDRYVNRLTPRRPRSGWSAVNIRRVAELTAAGRMRPEGLRAFEARAAGDNGYTYGDRPHAFEGELARRLEADPAAAAYFAAQPPSYRRQVVAWVTQAKREETRLRRLGTLIEDSAAGRRTAATLPAGRRMGA